MSQNFKLSYNMGFNYVDLFPKTSIEAIKFNQDISYQTSIFVTVPATTDLIQTIPIPITQKYLNVPVFMELLDGKKNDQYNYATISQFRIIENNLEITRLFLKPTDSINIVLIFTFNSSNALKYSELNVTIPQFVGTLQTVPINITNSQNFSPFSIKLNSIGNQAKQDYATITQAKIENNNLIITRLFEMPKGPIEVVLRFEEEGGF